MSRMDNFNYIEEMLNFFVLRLNSRAKINLLDLNIYAEPFFCELLNFLFGWNLENINLKKQNMEGIDLIDYKNKIIIQVTSIGNKRKLEAALNSRSIIDYKDYNFKFLYIGSDTIKLKEKYYYNSYDICFNPATDIIDIKYILKYIFNLSPIKQEYIKKLISEELEPVLNYDNKWVLFDAALNNLFDFKFYAKNDDKSDMISKLQEKEDKYFMQKMKKLIDENKHFIEKERKNNGLEKNDENSGKHFSIIDSSEIKTRFFEVFYYINFKTLSKEYFVNLLEHIEEPLDNGNNLLTFYIDKPNKYGNMLIMLSVDEIKNKCIINQGILLGNEVRLSLKPSSIYCGENEIDICNVSNCYYKKNNNEEQNLDIFFDATLNSRILIYDIIESIPVLREKYYNNKEEKWIAKVKLNKEHRYIALKIIPKNHTLSYEEIGIFYLNGDFGFPKNTIKALEYFEKAESANGYYQIGKIYIEDMVFMNKEMGMVYLLKAVKLGINEAKQLLEKIREIKYDC